MALILGEFVSIFRAEDGDADEYYFDMKSRCFYKKEANYIAEESHVQIARLRISDLYDEYLNIKGLYYLLPAEIHALKKLYGDINKNVAMLYLASAFGLDDDMNHYAYMATMKYIKDWATKNQIENAKLSYNAFDPRDFANYKDCFTRSLTKEEIEQMNEFMNKEIIMEAEDEREWATRKA